MCSGVCMWVHTPSAQLQYSLIENIHRTQHNPLQQIHIKGKQVSARHPCPWNIVLVICITRPCKNNYGFYSNLQHKGVTHSQSCVPPVISFGGAWPRAAVCQLGVSNVFSNGFCRVSCVCSFQRVWLHTDLIQICFPCRFESSC